MGAISDFYETLQFHIESGKPQNLDAAVVM